MPLNTDTFNAFLDKFMETPGAKFQTLFQEFFGKVDGISTEEESFSDLVEMIKWFIENLEEKM
jgi:hypothetical protein